MSWRLTDSRYIEALQPWRESVMTIANGHLSTRGSLEEPHPGRARATFVQGLFVTPTGGVAQQTAVPDWTDVRITIDEEELGVHRGWLVGHERSLDLRTGELERRLLWRGERTPTVGLRTRRLLPADRPDLAALELELRPLDGPAKVTIETGIDATVGSPDLRMWRPTDWSRAAAAELRLLATSLDDRHHLAVAVALEPGGAPAPVLVEDPFHPRLRFEWLLEAGEVWQVSKRVTYTLVTGAGATTPGAPPAIAYEDLLAASRAAWDQRWIGARVDIDGDADVELALRYAAFQLLAAAPRDDRASLPAKLLSGFGYLGHVFWDTDVFVVPWLTTAAPDLAANHVAYRWRGLAGARRKAARYGRTGAFYPWEADDQGEECTPDQIVPHVGGPPIEVHTARFEEHITADVAWSACDHLRWTEDDGKVRLQVAEIVVDTARYWADRIEIDPDGSAHLRDVIGPDEYHERVDDSWFTNQMVRWHLSAAAALGDQSRGRLPDDVGPSTHEVEAWRRLADRLVVLEDDRGIPLEHAGFDRLAPVDLTAWSPRRTTMERLLGEQVRRTGIVKQADVVMALALLGDDAGVELATTAAAFDHYLPRTDHGSSLSLPVHAWLAARLGRGDQAYELLRAGIAVEHDDAMGNGHVGLHAATNGGLLLATLRGIAGLRPGPDGPVTEASLPSHWNGIGFAAHQGGRRYDLTV